MSRPIPCAHCGGDTRNAPVALLCTKDGAYGERDCLLALRARRWQYLGAGMLLGLLVGSAFGCAPLRRANDAVVPDCREGSVARPQADGSFWIDDACSRLGRRP
jgi:hypothetical protein